MGRKVMLKGNIKFRKEKGHLLLCDCKTLETHSLPLKYHPILNRLKKGAYKEEIEKSLFEDLSVIKALD